MFVRLERESDGNIIKSGATVVAVVVVVTASLLKERMLQDLFAKANLVMVVL